MDKATITAIATPAGRGAIAMIRVSGDETTDIIRKIFRPARKYADMAELPGYTMYYGSLVRDNEWIDDVMLFVYRKPHSYTGEDMAEITCHGSPYIQQQILETLIKAGCRIAEPGEFTLRAFLNGKINLLQAEAIADLIASHSMASHQLAQKQMRGGFAKKIEALRSKLIDFASLIELELDFSEEDVEFADRNQLLGLLSELQTELSSLIDSFKLGNALKHGIPVAIVGKPNVGKSTLLNAMLDEERAIVSEIPGTTRDVIEDVITIRGVSFRFFDTAGLRPTTEVIETMGIKKTYEKIDQASIVLLLFDLNDFNTQELHETIASMKSDSNKDPKTIILVGNKTDLLTEIPHDFKELVEHETIFISAKRKENINLVFNSLIRIVEQHLDVSDAVVSNTRHLQALQQANEAIVSVINGIKDRLPSDLVSVDMRQALYHLGSITGQITTEEVLRNIFAKFCIGK